MVVQVWRDNLVLKQVKGLALEVNLKKASS